MSAFNKKTIYLHLGTYKTGTTFIQHVLYNTFDDPDSSVYFPRVGVHGTAHHYLATNEFPGWTNGVTQDEYKKMWERLLENIRGSAADCVLISSEMLCSLTLDRIRYIQETLRDYGLKAIIYLRRQDQYISSLAAQLIKGCNGKPEYYTDLNRAIEFVSGSKRFDYKNMCAHWASVIGKENLIVRPFERTQLYNGNILADFFYYLLGMQIPTSVELPTGNLNPRLCRDALEFKQLVNRMPVDRETMNATLPGLLAYSKVADERTHSVYQEHELLSPSQRFEILQCNADANSHIAQVYLGRKDGVLFEEPITDPTLEWSSYPGLNKEKLNAIVCFLANSTPSIMELLASAAPRGDHTDNELRRLSKVLACHIGLSESL